MAGAISVECFLISLIVLASVETFNVVETFNRERMSIDNFMELAQDNESETLLYLFAVFPTNGNLFHRQQLTRPAMDFAIEQINNESIAGEKLYLQFIGTDDLNTCNQIDRMGVYQIIEEVTVMTVMQGQLFNKIIAPIAFFGPGCAKAVEDIAQWVNAKFQVPYFDAIASSKALKDKTNYPTLVRTGYTEAQFIAFYKNVIDHFGWKNMTFLVDETDNIFKSISAPIKEEFGKVTVIRSICQPGFLNRTKLIELQYHSTALIFFANMDCVKNILLEAVRLNLTSSPGEPVQMTFIVNNFFDTKYWGTLNLKDDLNRTAKDREDLEKAYSQTFIASYYISPKLQEKMDNFTAVLVDFVKSNKKTYSDNMFYLDSLLEEGVNPAVLGYYTSVHIYAQAFNMLHLQAKSNTLDYKENNNKNSNYHNGLEIAKIIHKTKDFEIPHVGRIRLNDDGDTPGNFALKRFDEKFGNFVNWLKFSENDEHLVDLSDGFHYCAATSPVPKPASNDTEEDMQNDITKDESVSEEIIGLASLVVIIIAVSGIVIKYYVNKARLGSKWWIIDPAALKYLKDVDHHVSSRPHDTQTIRSEAFTCVTAEGIEFLEKEDQQDFQLAQYQAQIVAVQNTKRNWPGLCRKLLVELRDIRLNNHTNLLKFYGICVQRDTTRVVNEFTSRGSLADLFLGPQSELDWSLRYSLLHDLFEAMIYVHKSFGYHGRLTSFKCMIDRTFVLKLRDYAPKCLQAEPSEITAWGLLWTAPEILRKTLHDKEKITVQEYQKADIYSIGIILQQLIMECVPYPGPNKQHIILPPPDIINLVIDHAMDPPYRPLVPSTSDCDVRTREIMEDCWNQLPDNRPSLVVLKKRLRSVRGHVNGNLFDDLMERVQSYAGQLQQAVEERTQQLREEQQKIQALLYELLPKSVADRLISKNPVDPEPFDCVTIYFSDIVSFTTIAATSTAAEVVCMLNQLYQLFDGIIDFYDAYKVETIGDAYMVVSGLPKRNGCSHGPIISQLALNILQAAGNFRIPHRPHDKFKMRIGVHSGPCVAGVVGNKMPRYCLFGDTVNTASRMESTSEPNRVQLSKATAQLIQGRDEFHLEPRGVIDVKGKGAMETFWLTPSPALLCFSAPVVDDTSYMRRATFTTQNSQETLLNLNHNSQRLPH